MFKEFQVHFKDNKEHPKGIYTTLTAINKQQAESFANMIAKALEIEWKSKVDWTLI
ncbi:hypothetical protein [Brevibacillus gelatini]|uniref:hypothetical protein n=1 Tax=Brevibacillus gelatini TaxID=1655277 RepID=UPI001473A745|nr:hypothetical protein [Brevibacillus gelatini]